MTELVKSGTLLQGKSSKFLKDTKTWCMPLHSTIHMGTYSTCMNWSLLDVKGQLCTQKTSHFSIIGLISPWPM